MGPILKSKNDEGEVRSGAGVDSKHFSRREIAVLIPCHNEAAAVAKVVEDFRAALPSATIYVYDNNSTDGTAEKARNAGAVVRREERQGKGHVVRRMFGDVDAEVYLLVDGDGTYDALSADAMIARLIEDRLDMVVGARIEQNKAAQRPRHRAGNRILTGFVALMFRRPITDMLSGYRVFTRRFIKSFPVSSAGFEIETELTVHALELDLPIAEVPTPYYPRPLGSASKLHTYRDGLRILWTIVRLYKSERPLSFFTIIGAVLATIAVVLAIPIFATYLAEGIVPRLPTAVLSTGLMLLASLLLTCGLILSTVTRGRREMKALAYLQQDIPDASKIRPPGHRAPF
jgi:glycosyltransferase involved in cell wall biosynthesis